MGDREGRTGRFLALPVSYRRHRSRILCAVMTATSWLSALPNRKTRRPLANASLVSYSELAARR
jgi:hypothetical protein